MPFFAQMTTNMLGDLGQLIAGTTLLGKIVLLILLAMSVISWALMVERGRRLGKARRGNAGFWQRFRTGSGDAASVRELADWSRQQKGSPLATVYNWFSGEFWSDYSARGADDRGAYRQMLARGVDRMANDEMDKLERGLSWLATFTSTAPFIGLLGTVYGILTSFLEIGRQGSASLDAVGPGIAESLVATVAGLAVAIPAAVAYNYFVSKLKQHDSDLQALASHLEDLLVRDELAENANPIREKALS